MLNFASDKIRTIIIIGVLTLSAFFIRLDVVVRPQWRTIDEIVYYNLGRQLRGGLSNYHSIPVAKALAAEGRVLPEYFTQPLFKHPPLFALLISGALGIYGDDAVAAEIVSLTFGVLLIPLVYFLGRLLFDRRTGLVSAFFLYIDPISIMCSQKVWMETTLTFFTILGLYLFARGLINKNGNLFILSGLSVGLAALTKYPGILTAFLLLLYAACCRHDLLRDRKFMLGLLMPWVMLAPWFGWIYRVYGGDFYARHFGVHNFQISCFRTIYILAFLAGLLLIAFLSHRYLRGGVRAGAMARIIARIDGDDLGRWVRLIMGVGFFALFARPLLSGVEFDHLPKTSWVPGLFRDAGRGFYLGKLLEYSLLYAFAFLAYFIHFRERGDRIALLKLGGLVIIAFYTIYGSYQSRYVLSAIPLLIVLAVHTWGTLFSRVSAHPRPVINFAGRLLLILAGVVIVAKASLINILVSFTNDMCYF